MSAAPTTLALLAALLPAPRAQEPPTGGDPAAALAAAVDLATPALRRAAAEALARRPGIGVDQWLQHCASFGAFAAAEPGPTRHTADLQVGDAVERTELFVYVPKGYDPQRPAPLLLSGHGAGGTGAREYLHWQAAADALGMLVLAPTEAGTEAGWAFTERERRAQLAALRWARRRWNVDEDRVFVAGFSRGGHMTWDLILRFPDLFAAAVPVVGGPRLQLTGGQNNLRYLENVAHLPLRDLQGAGDDPLLLENLRLAFARLRALGSKDAVLLEQQGHAHGADLKAVDWQQFFGACRRTPVPARVVRLSADKDETRAFWVELAALDGKVAVDFPLQVPAQKWQSLDEAGRRALLLDLAVERTARLQVEMTAPGRFRAEGRGVRRFRLLLTAAMVAADGSVEVAFGGRTVKRKPRPDAKALLCEFVDRFDRRFLPVAVVEVP